MQFHQTFSIPRLEPPLRYGERLLLLGSCFSEHIGERLVRGQFAPVINPHGILFTPASIAAAVENYIDGRRYTPDDLFYFQGRWHSWDHHGRFSDADAGRCLQQINARMQEGSDRVRKAEWLILSFGSAHAYRLQADGRLVANCHQLPGNIFDKILLSQAQVVAALDHMLHRLFDVNSAVRVIFTISPVRYAKDGLVASNCSKAVLLTAVHHLVEKFERLYYFPAYELVVDDLRDYRFFGPDLVHPNELAIGYVWEKFCAYALDASSRELLGEVEEVVRAASHRPVHPGGDAHRAFASGQLERIARLEARHPFLDFSKEKAVFGAGTEPGRPA